MCAGSSSRKAPRLFHKLRPSSHGLRHSFASLCYHLGIPAKIAMQLGGWSDMQTMLRIYTHISQRDIGARVEDLRSFFQTKNGNENANAAQQAIEPQAL